MLPFYVLVCTFSLMTTPTQLPFYCSVTAVIAEHSFFLWKQKPSASLDPFKLAIQKLNLSADLTKIKTTIKEASHLKTKDKKYALVKIALENRLGEFLIFQVFQCPSLIFDFSFIREKASFQNFIIAIHVSSYHCYDAILPLVLKKHFASFKPNKVKHGKVYPLFLLSSHPSLWPSKKKNQLFELPYASTVKATLGHLWKLG